MVHGSQQVLNCNTTLRNIYYQQQRHAQFPRDIINNLQINKYKMSVNRVNTAEFTMEFQS